jgi:hypothetical protein
MKDEMTPWQKVVFDLLKATGSKESEELDRMKAERPEEYDEAFKMWRLAEFMGKNSNTPLLDMIMEHDADPVLFAKTHNMTENKMQAYPNAMCMWRPCSYILFGQNGETHEEYHKRKGIC